jgi:integrase/recombinase XerD
MRRHLAGLLEHNPALSVKAPRQKLGKGKTPVLTAEEAGELLRSIETDTVVGLRDRARIAGVPHCADPWLSSL